MGRWLKIKKSIMGSFGAFRRTERRGVTSRPDPTPLDVTQQQHSDSASDQPHPNFKSVMEFPSAKCVENKTGAGLSEPKAQIETPMADTQETAACLTHRQNTKNMWNHPLDAESSVNSCPEEEQDEDSLYNTVGEISPHQQPRAVPNPRAGNRLSLPEPAVYANPSKDLRCANRVISLLAVPTEGPSLSSRRNSPVYEAVGPACPPRDYDQLEEHSDIATRLEEKAFARCEDKQPDSTRLNDSCATLPLRRPADRMHLDSRINESLFYGRAGHREDIIDLLDQRRQGDQNSSRPTRLHWGLAKTRQEKTMMRDKSTQTELAFFAFEGDGSAILRIRKSPNADIKTHNCRASGDSVNKPSPRRFKHPQNMNPTLRQKDNHYCVPLAVAPNCTIGRIFRYPDHELFDSTSVSHQEAVNARTPMNGQVVMSDTQHSFQITAPKNAGNSIIAVSYASSTTLLSPPSANTTRASSDDARSIFSSEGADSDFVFYSGAPVIDKESGSTTADVGSRESTLGRSNSFVREDSFVLNDTSRSDFYGSSLDEVTRQFFLDDDALSDDVFMEEAEQYKYPLWKYNNDPSPRTLDSIKENCPSELCDAIGNGHWQASFDEDCTSTGERGKERCTVQTNDKIELTSDASAKSNSCSYSSVRSDEMYAYKYDDIEEVLDNFKDLSTSGNIAHGRNPSETLNLYLMDGENSYNANNSKKLPGRGRENQSFSRNHGETLITTKEAVSSNQDIDSDILAQRLSSHKSGSDNCEEMDNRFADMFDSLRKNSIQSKARQMWRKRRSNCKRGLRVAPHMTFIGVEKQTELNDMEDSNGITESQTIFLRPIHGEESASLVKPLRGILKRSVLPQAVSVAERNLCNFRNENSDGGSRKLIQRRRARSLGLEVYPLERTEAMYSREIQDMQYKAAKANSPQFPVNAPDFNNYLNKGREYCQKRRSRSLTTETYSIRRNEADFYPQRKDSLRREARDSPCLNNLSNKIKPVAVKQSQPPADEHQNEAVDLSAHNAATALRPRVNNNTALAGPSRSPTPNRSYTDKMPMASNGQVDGASSTYENFEPRQLPAVVCMREAGLARKNSLDVYRWHTCVHRRRKLQDRKDGKLGPHGNQTSLVFQQTRGLHSTKTSTATL